MNRIATFSMIASLSALSFAGIANGQGAEMNWPKEIEQTVRSYSGDKINVVDVSTLSEQDQTRMWVDKATPEQRAALHEAVEANKSLAEKLKAQNVEMNNIGGAEQAADGGLTIYVR
ncbi:hypothetical protein HR059_31385 (plasmid) [Sinorhizobium meliloti WSM1022]|uniref:Uncharacterized protein n=1 Tax=Sinorhizobium medicae TaxID=110321 RepID=A0A6G1WQR2_9HYPH|nr:MULTISPECIES: hypothetical protein [Sinorhizobium]MCO6426289.1 hypothetical protein [Sinorhizobium meliloti]MDE3761544.1 hypothetical protein [Sinorhizobium meliloti]MDE3831367.1 hypothetical protein [Sinorhizobium meliloti]MDE4579050.1 hypothetical protein [Sinorhizobium meliloti]MDW9419179.1 hypothetical protein [Sinorhizobium meliloti]